MISKLSSLLIKYLTNNEGEFTIKRVDTLLFDNDNIDSIDLKEKKYILEWI